MAQQDVAAGIPTVGVAVFVRDPNAAADSFLSKYQRVPGIGQITLPSEDSPSNDEVMLDGVGQAQGFASPGSITVPIARLNQHPTHRLLTEKNIGGGKVEARIVRAAEAISSFLNADAAPAIAAGVGGVSVVSRNAAAKFDAVRPGHYVAWGAAAAVAGSVDVASAADDDGLHWRPVLDVADDQRTFRIGYGVGAAVAAGNGINLYVRTAGMRWSDLICAVGTMGKGDASAAQSIAGNLVLRPDSDIGLSTVWMSTAKPTGA